MSDNDKLEELEKRISNLEGIERRRRIRFIISLIIRIVFYVMLVIGGIYAWNYINENVIKPYHEAIDKIDAAKESGSDAISKYKNYFK